jgi:outer membrane PBP1 activator LpoA protein
MDLKNMLETDKDSLLFAALDAQQARQVRAAIGKAMPLYGTSQLNPYVAGAASGEERALDMDGTRLLDIPWQLQRDHPAVMIYPRLVIGVDQKPDADLERLYALGIDAYRIAREVAQKRTSFELDGVTGRLQVRFDQEAPFFQRTQQQAVYRDGAVVPLAKSR